MGNNFNQLTPDQTERLSILAEEMGEALHIIGKILRHGLHSYDPTEDNQYKTNDVLLSVEMGDILHAFDMLYESGDIHENAVLLRKMARPKKIAPYLHHQPLAESNDNRNILDSELFIKEHKIVVIRTGDNRRIGFRCPECNATAGFLVELPHKRSCGIPDWTGKLSKSKGEK